MNKSQTTREALEHAYKNAAPANAVESPLDRMNAILGSGVAASPSLSRIKQLTELQGILQQHGFSESPVIAELRELIQAEAKSVTKKFYEAQKAQEQVEKDARRASRKARKESAE